MIMTHRIYRCTRELPYSATSHRGHYDLFVRDHFYISATNAADALEQMGERFPLDIARTSHEDAFTVDCLEGMNYGRASFEAIAEAHDTDPPSDNNQTTVDLTEDEVELFVEDFEEVDFT
jgi:hypothetical protein